MISYLLFCFGAALTQGSWAKSSGINPLYTPIWWGFPAGKLFVFFIAMGSFVAEILLGISFISWWAGLLSWVPALFIASVFIPGGAASTRNPAHTFFVGVLIMICAAFTL